MLSHSWIITSLRMQGDRFLSKSGSVLLEDVSVLTTPTLKRESHLNSKFLFALILLQVSPSDYVKDLNISRRLLV